MTLCHGNRIRQRAHEIYLSRDGAAGCAEVDWLQAEMELRASKTKARFKTVMDSKGACQPPRGRR
ncbi:MAG: DUF2934 domain-containing protein [Phycisphaerae bacterium]|nr:DUF2934 domain-containing protein [Phycisphaerae bacterium]